ncbi:MAG: DUF881 domain-containing protein [Fimbriimonadaceae bacterium]
MNIFNTQPANNWVIPVSILSVVLGFMLTMAWMTKENRDERLASLPPEQQTRLRQGSLDLRDEYMKLTEENESIRAAMVSLREEKTRLENALAEQGDQGKILNDSLQKTKLAAGLTPVEGAGLVVTLRDSRLPESDRISVNELIIHDADVLRVVNELWAAGAAAIGVNGHRVVTGTAFRCVGNVILVDNTPIAPPIRISAIGNPDTLMGAINIPLGVLSEMRSTDPGMVSLQKEKQIRLNAYSGPLRAEALEVPKDER